ncbi:hypothetical protein BGX31_003893 [Mortierella sp. GBA43]|nr:hypothetical protein BGX31_003893 [Mortierella sp. GBA43]
MSAQFTPFSSIIEALGSDMDKLKVNPRASVEPLATAINGLVTSLGKIKLNQDPIPKYLLPEGAVPFRSEVLSAPDEHMHEYIVLGTTLDYTSWIESFGRATGATFLFRSSKPTNNADVRAEYLCDRSGSYISQAGKNPNVQARLQQKPSKKVRCEARVIIRVSEKEGATFIKIKGHTGHAIDIGNMRLSRDVRNFIADCIIEGLDTKGVRDIFKKRQDAL